MAYIRRQGRTAEPAGGFLGTGAILILMAILVLLVIGLAWLLFLWLPSAESV